MATKWGKKEGMKKKLNRAPVRSAMCDGCDGRASFVRDREGAFVECLYPNSFSIIIIFIIFPIYFDAFHWIAVIFVVYPAHSNTHTHSQARTLSHRSVVVGVDIHNTTRSNIFYPPTDTPSISNTWRAWEQATSLTHSLSLSGSIYRWVYVRSPLRASLCVLIVLLSKWRKKWFNI